MNYIPFIWLAVVIFALIIEASTAALVSVWFIPGALVSMILAFCKVSIWIQIPVFVLLSFVLLIFMKPISRKLLRVKHTPTNADAVIGERAVVTETINNLQGQGQVKVKGQIWTARASSENITYERGEILNVIAIEGVKLICKK